MSEARNTGNLYSQKKNADTMAKLAMGIDETPED